MTTYPAFPDAEAVVAAWLRAHVPGPPRVYSSVPAKPTYPLVTVARTGGTPAVRQYLDAPRIDVNVWGNSKSEAYDLSAACRKALMEMEGQRVTDPVAAFVAGVDDVIGATFLPDETTARDRYVFSVTVYLR